MSNRGKRNRRRQAQALEPDHAAAGPWIKRTWQSLGRYDRSFFGLVGCDLIRTIPIWLGVSLVITVAFWNQPFLWLVVSGVIKENIKFVVLCSLIGAATIKITRNGEEAVHRWTFALAGVAVFGLYRFFVGGGGLSWPALVDILAVSLAPGFVVGDRMIAALYGPNSNRPMRRRSFGRGWQ